MVWVHCVVSCCCLLLAGCVTNMRVMRVHDAHPLTALPIACCCACFTCQCTWREAGRDCLVQAGRVCAACQAVM